DHLQIVHNVDVIAVEHPVLGAMRQIGPLARLSTTPLQPGAPARPLATAATWEGRSPHAEVGGVSAAGGAPTNSALDDLLVIDFATVQGINPRLVYVYAGAYGSTGPSSHRPAFHPIAGAIAGNALWQAGAAWPPPTAAASIPDELRELSRQLHKANEGNPDP